MKKIKLFLAAATLLFGGSLWAQTDVTSTYITDADLSATTNWTEYHSGSYWSLGNGLIGTYCVANTYTSTADEKHLDTEYCFGMQCRWQTNYAAYQQTKENATLAAGAYTLTFDVQNTNTSTTSATYNNLFYVKVGETTYSDTSTEWMGGNSAWTTHTISFTLEEATTTDLVFSFGYGTGSNNFGTGNTPHLYVSHLALTLSEFIDPTAIALSDVTMIPTATKTLSVVYTPTDANHNTAITWTSSNESVATVSAAGVVTAVAAGTATITATTDNSVSTTCTVTVNEAPIANGDYYLKNVATGKYLSSVKNGWGTQAGISVHGIPFTATLANGAYTLDSKTYNNASQHFLNGTYVDGNATSIYITALGSGKYSLSTAEGSAFLTANNDDAVVANTASDATSELAQWIFVTKDELEAALADATEESPVDATFYIADPDFSRNYWPAGQNTSSWTVTASNKNLKGGNNGNMCGETYQNGGGTIYQTLAVPNGRYGVKCQGFYRQDSGSTPSYLYSNDGLKQELSVFNANDEGTAASMSGASASFSAGLYQSDELIVNVTDGSLIVGIEGQAGNWTCFDNFELYYYGPIIGGEAEELPETAMTAGNWYYFDIAVDGDYDLTLTTLDDIVYTTDGTILIENEDDVTDTFSGTSEITLTAGRYYVKSASAQTLTVAAHTFTYEVGNPTPSVADNGYSQSTTITLTYSDAATNDPDGEFQILDASKITVDGKTAEASISDKVLTITLTDAVTVGASYVVSVAAGAVGYNTDDAANYNTATSLTINTPIVLDGEYCLYDATNKLFLGRGAGYGTEATADKYGIPVKLTTDATGASNVQFIDNNAYLFIASNGVFTDGGVFAWTVNSATDGYTLSGIFNEATKYLTHAAGSFGEYVTTTDAAASATVWTLKTLAERDAIIAAYPTDNINNVITASGISTTADAFASYLSSNYDAVDCTSSIGTATFANAAGDWTWAGYWRNQDGQPAYGTGFVEAWNATGAWTQTIDKANLPAGIYKVTVQGYERRKANDAATALKTAGYNVVSTFLSANDEQVRFTDWNDVAGKPTDTSGAVTAFTNGEAVNEVYVYLDGNTDLSLMVRKPNYIWDCWVIWNNVTLTRYEKAEATMVIGDAKYGTFVAPFDVTIPSGVKAYTVDAAEGNTLTLTEKVTTIPANTPVVLESETAKNETFYGKTVAGDPKAGLLTGTYTDIDAPNGSYVLQKQGDVVGFYQVDTNAATPKVRANRAYLTAPAGGEVKAFYLGGGEDAIKSVFEGVAAGEVYDLSGRKLSKLQRGVNIVNGKKVIVK